MPGFLPLVLRPILLLLTVHTAPNPAVAIRPSLDQWSCIAALAIARRPAAAAEFRRQLGLPVSDDKPVIMSGHQAELWHPGILAKAITADHAASLAGTRACWISVDQDSNEPCRVAYPAIDTRGGLVQALWSWSDDLSSAADIPTGSRPSVMHPASGWPKPAATGHIAAALATACAALARHAHSPTLAAQVTSAAFELASAVVATPTVVPASRLASTSLWVRVIDRMDADPAACIASYNRAVAAVPEARLSPLNAARGELPLWRLAAGEPRGRITAATLGRFDRTQLAPRALLMTGLLRHAGCDLFIHGLGGELYDRAAELWLRDWLGWDLAPMAVATATLLLPLLGHDAPTEVETTRARWQAHHARHAPSLLGDVWAQQRKLELVAEIRDAKSRGRNPAPLFDEMHRLLSRVRLEHEAALAGLASHAQALASTLASSRVANDRTFSAALHEPASLARLRVLLTGSSPTPIPGSRTAS